MNDSQIPTKSMKSQIPTKSFFRTATCAVVALAMQFTFTNETIAQPAASSSLKPRVIATTDGEVDDRSTMIRFLMYSCDFDVVGIIQVNSKYQKHGHSDQKWIEKELDAYEKVLPNLRKNNPDYPDASQLRSVVRVGNENKADLYVAPPDMGTKDTPGEELIIRTLLDKDPRPVHVLSWGGANTTASALWRLRTHYSKQQFDYAVSRIRICCIWYQDGGGGWIQTNIPQAHIIEAYRWDNVWDYESYDNARKPGKLSANPPFIQEYMKPAWLDANIKNDHGPLGALYPQKYISEGDTPSFLDLINNGLEAYRDYTLGGWGGRFAYDNPAFPNHLTDKHLKDDGNRNKMYWRWIPAAQNDFAARMEWCVKPFDQANHEPVVKLTNPSNMEVKPGEKVSLSAKGTSDPDGNTLTYKWWEYEDADTYPGSVQIEDSDKQNASMTVPAGAKAGQTIQIICEVTDNGTPPLTGYRRVLMTVQK